MLAEKDPYIDEALQELNKINKDSQLSEAYFRRRMAIMDYNTQMAYAREEGEAKGKIEVAKNLIVLGLDIDKIAKATALSIDEIKELQANKRL